MKHSLSVDFFSITFLIQVRGNDYEPGTPTACIWSRFKLLQMLYWAKNDTAVYQNLNWSQSFPSVLNSNSYPGPGINKSQCQDHCGQYSFSMRPERNDFALIRVGLTISTVLSEFWNTMDQKFFEIFENLFLKNILSWY